MFRRNLLLLVAASAHPPHALGAQALLGFVIDSVTQQGLHGVGVAVLDTDLSARTDADGTFAIQGITSGEVVLTFQAGGYVTAGLRLQLNIDDDRNVSIGIITLSPAATVTGFVFDSATGRPLFDVEVGIPELGIAASTDGQGEFILDGIPTGTHVFAFRRLGYLGAEVEAELAVTEPTQMSLGAVVLAPTALLKTIEVMADRGESMIMPDFAELKRTGQGRYVTAADIARLNPRNTSEIVRRLGGFTSGGDDGIGLGTGRIQGSRGSNCTTGYFVDGVRSTSETVDVIQPQAIAGLEFYSGPATIPAQYQTPFAPTCGLIVVWTRDASNRSGNRN